MTGAWPDQNVVAARPGSVLGGKYRVERELARGGMGVVVVARHLKLDRLVAIKLLGVTGAERAHVAARFLREARAAARLGGDHVVRIIDLDETPDGTPYLVMELLDGVDLDRALQSEGLPPPARVVDWALQACAALAEAHARGVVHRDIKPSNLLRIRRVDGAELIKLVDFGISKLVDEEVQLTKTATALGSPLFMSPEQLLSPKGVDARSDIWSLGVTLYRLLSAKTPFEATDAASLAALIAARPPAPLLDAAPRLAPELCAVVMRCLEKDPEARWPDVVTLADALEPFRAATGLGSAASVRLADAQAKASLSQPQPAAPGADSRDRLTLSHDLPHATPGAHARERSTPSHPVPHPTPHPTPGPAAPLRRTSRVMLAALALAAVLAGGAWFAASSSRVSKAEVMVALPGPAEALATPSAVAPAAPAAPTAAAPDAGLLPRPRPARVTAPGNVKDPSMLELK